MSTSQQSKKDKDQPVTKFLGAGSWAGLGVILATLVGLGAWLLPRSPDPTPSPIVTVGPYSSSEAGDSPASPESDTTPGIDEALANVAASSVVRNCTPNRQLETSARPAVLDCAAVNPGPDVVRLERFASRGDLDDWLSTIWAVPPSGSGCATSLQTTAWAHSGQAYGRLECGPSDTQQWIAWTFDDQLVGALIKGSDGGSMFSWWQQNAFLLELQGNSGNTDANVP